MISEAKPLINEVEAEADKKLEEDDRTFVDYFTREKLEDNNGFEWIVNSRNELIIFEDEEEADEFIQNLKDHQVGRIIRKEDAYSKFPEEV